MESGGEGRAGKIAGVEAAQAERRDPFTLQGGAAIVDRMAGGSGRLVRNVPAFRAQGGDAPALQSWGPASPAPPRRSCHAPPTLRALRLDSSGRGDSLL